VSVSQHYCIIIVCATSLESTSVYYTGENMKLFLLPCLLAVCHLAGLEAAPMEDTEPGTVTGSAEVDDRAWTTTTTPRPCMGKCLECPWPYTLHGTACFYYKSQEEKLSWNEAAQICKDKSGGTLPVLYSSEIKQYVRQQFRGISYIGLTDKAEESKWKWEDGTEYSMKNSDWARGEPNNVGGREDCVEFWGEKYNDIPCGKDYHRRKVSLLCMMTPKLVDNPCTDNPEIIRWDAEYCSSHKNKGHCKDSSYYVHMLDKCRKTCELCNVKCNDSESERWCSDKRHQCNHDDPPGRDVKEKCQKTCKLC